MTNDKPLTRNSASDMERFEIQTGTQGFYKGCSNERQHIQRLINKRLRYIFLLVCTNVLLYLSLLLVQPSEEKEGLLVVKLTHHQSIFHL